MVARCGGASPAPARNYRSPVKEYKSEDRSPPSSDSDSPSRSSLDKDLTDLVAGIEEVPKDRKEAKTQVSPEFD